MKYASPKPGLQFLHKGVRYEQCITDEEVIETVIKGELLHIDDYYEIWEYGGIVAILPLAFGILE